MLNILVTFAVLSPVKFKVIRLEQVENIYDISVTFDVSRPLRSIDEILLVPENNRAIVVAVDVSKFENEIDVSDELFENKYELSAGAKIFFESTNARLFPLA